MTDSPPTRPHTRRNIVAVAVGVLVVYSLVLLAYAGGNSSSATDTREPDADGVLVYLDLGAVNGQEFSIDARVWVYPGRNLLDDNGFLKNDLVVDVTPVASDTATAFAAGRSIGPIATTIEGDGDIRRWPFDRYRADSVVVDVFTTAGDADPVPVPSTVAVTNSLTGWTVEGSDDHTGGESFDITVARNTVTKVYDLALCAILLALPACALFVAVNTVRRRKKFQPPMVTWFAVMLFAVLPIRNLFPGAPPTGSWVDFAVVLWVVLGLMVAMVLYVYTWWRDAP